MIVDSSQQEIMKPKSKTIVKTKSTPFTDFLYNHRVIKGSNVQATHTRIGDDSKGIFGGSFHIPDEEWFTFMQLYYNDIIKKGKPEYLTEKQWVENDKTGPVAIDIDLHFAIDVRERLYTSDHIVDLLFAYLATLKDMYQFDEDTKFPVFVFQKSQVNRVPSKNITKDGIHIIIGIQMDRKAQRILRENIISKIDEMWADLPIVNQWKEVFDEGITNGHTNWQLYGSQKPGHESYQLTTVYNVTYDPIDGEWITNNEDIANYLNQDNFHKLSVRYNEHPQYFYTNAFLQTLSAVSDNTKDSRRRTPSPQVTQEWGNEIDVATISRIRNANELEMCLNRYLDSLSPTEYRLRETYEYTMTLPEEYYGVGSYTKWMKTGWALRNTSNRMLIVWIAFSARSSTFDYSSIPDLCDRWSSWDKKTRGGITDRSIVYWAMHGNPEGFQSVKENTIGYYLDQTINTITINSLNAANKNAKGCGDYDIAVVLHQMRKDEYVYCSDNWYRYQNHRWKMVADGSSLRLTISNELREMYRKRAEEMNAYKASLDPDDDKYKILSAKIEATLKIYLRLGQTHDKKNIMQEAKDLFNETEFLNKLDSNPYLLCFKNGVIDFESPEKGLIFRDGRPEDYLTKCTEIDYVPISTSKHADVKAEIIDFMTKLFPDPDVRKYMWDHLSSVLIGTASVNQTFNNYIGAGQNGKSVLTDLMSQVLGTYKVSAPISLITQQRIKIGGLAPEIVQLKGARYVVMQEPSKGDVINEGPMKELVSGVEPISARGLYMHEPVTFIPQFKLIVCANEFLVIKAQDHGTWRRIRVVPFESLFTENPVQNDEDKPHQYKLDKHLKDRFPVWRETFAAMLVDRAYDTKGVVEDCPRVLAASDEYRKRQDYLAEFIADKVVRCVGATIRKSQLSEEFKVWFNINFGTKNPSPKDLHEYMDRQFGKQRSGVWSGVKLKMRGEDEDDYIQNSSVASGSTTNYNVEDDMGEEIELNEI